LEQAGRKGYPEKRFEQNASVLRDTLLEKRIPLANSQMEFD
jgi:hypothetical protein